MTAPVRVEVGGPALLEVADLAKNYGGVQALRGASLRVHAGAIHALLGENGTGKSTLMKIVAGVEVPSAGTVRLAGAQIAAPGGPAGRHPGIGIVFQELSLFPDLDVLANLFAGREPTRGRLVDRAAMAHRAAPVLARVGLNVPLGTLVGRLSLAERQLVEICKALLGDASLLILDEPSSALNAVESARLFRLVRDLRDQGVGIIYISHRLEEVFALADRITVMRGGRVVDTGLAGEMSIPSVVRTMLGDSTARIEPAARRPAPAGGSMAVELSDVVVPGALAGVSLAAGAGEVLGLVGLDGAGHAIVLDLLFGTAAPSAGQTRLFGQPWRPRRPRDAVAAGVAFVPPDRARAGLMMLRSVADNIAQVRLTRSSGSDRMVRRRVVHQRARHWVERLGIRTASVGRPVNTLSGGNQQKVVLAKWLEVEPRLVLLNDPTRGVDVGGKADLYAIIRDLAGAGATVLFTSTELAEFALLCDRVLVFQAGRVVGTVTAAAATEHVLLEAVNTGRIPPT